MAEGKEIEEDHYSGRGVFHHGMDDLSHNSNLDNCAENMGSLQHSTNLKGKSQDIAEWLRCH